MIQEQIIRRSQLEQQGAKVAGCFLWEITQADPKAAPDRAILWNLI
jgi:hypothetical protein